MIVEVVAVGTELLLGQIVNGNAARIGRAIAESGFDAHHQQVVGDNLGRIVDVLDRAIGRSDAVIVTGGIGPTQDDITREAVSEVTGRPLLISHEYVAELRARFERWSREMPESNLRQAQYPEGAELLPNPKGTAPGIALLHDDTWIYLLPGVPEEMELLLTGEVMPRLRRQAGVGSVLESRVLRSWGMAEAAVGELLDDLYRGSTNPSLAFLASSGEIKIRITAKAADAELAQRLIEPIEREVRRRMGSSVFGADDDTIEPVVLREVEARGWAIGTAESATAGMVVARLASVPGASRVLRGSVVPYATDVKRSVLDIDPDVLDRGVVSEETALAMAAGARRVLDADVAVAVTGSAGPDPLERDVGTLVVAVETPEDARARTLRLPGDRERVRTYGATAALHLARLAITGVWWGR